ncbi:MAG: ribonuclease J, partial [Clostridia bacterium]|nr:ribonuclease J [Clostridia bacterium]
MENVKNERRGERKFRTPKRNGDKNTQNANSAAFTENSENKRNINRQDGKKPRPQEKPQKPQKMRKQSAPEKPGKKVKRGAKPVKIVFLGGVGEIGKNMTAIECGDDIIIIDAGAIFPTEETPGIDLIVPDITYLVENKRKVRALVLTHGHEDHIGGVPYLLKELKVPVYGTKLTLALVDSKLREHRINDTKQITVTTGHTLQIGCFKIRFVNVNHSIAGSLALAIETPQGVIFHSGDFKIDLTPVAGEPIDLKTISDIGAQGVLLYMGESTNIERQGFTMSETTVGATLDRLFAENSERRLIVATFASNVHRLQQIVD